MKKIESKSDSDSVAGECGESVSDYKKLLQEHSKKAFRDFCANTPIFDLLKSRSDLIDRILIESWKRFLCTDTDSFALVAIGGYGRRELHPFSDIDLLIIHQSDVSEQHTQALENFLRFLWDIGLQLGHRLSTLEECGESAKADQVYTTALIESRLLYGSDSIFQAMKTQTGPDRIWPSTHYFDAKIKEQKERYLKFNESGYNLEPNVKESPGGLRDFHMIAWLKKRHYRSATLHELVDKECLTRSEYAELMSGQEFLCKIRFALHSLTGRPENRLLFDYQSQLAELFQYKDLPESSAVEQFMQKYYRTVMAIERLSEMLLQLFREVIFGDYENMEIEPINSRFQSLGKYIEVTYNSVFADHPPALLEIFLLQQQIPGLIGIRASTIRLIRQNLDLIDDQFRSNPVNSRLFVEILSQRDGITHQLRRMNRYGVLAHYMPAFGHIVGRIQYDLFHIYTVDQHTLFLVRNLRRFAQSQYANELPLCNDIFLLIAKPALLYLAALMHDIAKGKGGDHSVLGEQIAIEFCQQHQLTNHETDLVAWLVRHHLVMSMTAQKKDLSDPHVIHEFASSVGTIERLNYLYLLTIADIRATNPQIWNSWKDRLLKELYFKTQRTLHRGLKSPIDQSVTVRNTRNEARSILLRLGLAETTIESVWINFSDHYFLRYATEEAVWHTTAIAFNDPQQLPLVLLRPQHQRGSAEVLLYTEDHDQLFSQSTAILDHLGLTILDARIVTTKNNRVVNSYLVLEQSGEAIRDLYREHQICFELQRRMALSHPNWQTTGRKVSRQAKFFPITPNITFDEEPGQRTTLLELSVADQPGLLSRIGQAFNRLDIRVHQAKITTIGNRAEDVFYISDSKNRPIDSQDLRGEIRQAVLEAVNG